MATKKAAGGANKTLEDLFLEELRDMYDAEKRLVTALPKMAKAVTSEELQQAITNHAEETAGHVQKLESVFQTLGRDPKGKKCEAMVGLIGEGDGVTSDFKGSKALDAAIIAAA